MPNVGARCISDKGSEFGVVPCSPCPEPLRFVVLVCGGRDYTNDTAIFEELDKLHAGRPITQIVHGGATGTDSIAGQWAAARGVPALTFKPYWSQGLGAGHIRNARMLREAQPDLVVAFPGGKGTKGMKELTRAAGVPLLEGAPKHHADNQTPPRPRAATAKALAVLVAAFVVVGAPNEAAAKRDPVQSFMTKNAGKGYSSTSRYRGAYRGGNGQWRSR